MAIKAPEFWWRQKSLQKLLLSPCAWVYALFANQTLTKKSVPFVDLPVFCVGNFTLGGAGKTPVAIAFANAAKTMGLRTGIVSRGYGSKVQGVHLVDPSNDLAKDVGDEPLLLARHALVAIAADRYKAAQRLHLEGCDFIIMDDGFQSRRLHIDYALLVVDALRGVGNGAVFPAGPLRASLSKQLALSDHILIVGEGVGEKQVVDIAEQSNKPVEFAKLAPFASGAVKGKKFLAFAGIGNPDKFFKSIIELGGVVEKKQIYADHHFFSNNDLSNISQSAEKLGLKIATTAKDYIRISAKEQVGILKNPTIFDVNIDFEDMGFCQRVIIETLVRFKNRK